MSADLLKFIIGAFILWLAVMCVYGVVIRNSRRKLAEALAPVSRGTFWCKSYMRLIIRTEYIRVTGMEDGRVHFIGVDAHCQPIGTKVNMDHERFLHQYRPLNHA